VENVAGTDAHLYFGGQIEFTPEKIDGIWEILSATMEIDTDATVVNRQATIGVGTRGGVGQDSFSSVAITANQLVKVGLRRMGSVSNMTIGYYSSGNLSYYSGTNPGFGQFAGLNEYAVAYLHQGVAGDIYNFEFVLKCLNLKYGLVPPSWFKQ